MSTQILHGQMTVIDDDGNITILHQEASASDILVNKDTNTHGANGGSSIPVDVDTVQKLTNKMGDLSFKSKVEYDDLAESLIDALDLAKNFYIPLLKNANDTYVSQKTVSEIEEAYQKEKALWVIASDIFLPLSKRVDADNWIFSGYTATQGYDIQISSSGVTITYKDILTTDIIKGLQTDFDEDTNTVSFI